MVIRTNGFMLFGKLIPFYAILFVAGFAVAVLTALPKVKKYKMPKVEIVTSAVFAIVGGIVGAKLLSIIQNIPLIIEFYKINGYIPFLDLMRGGFVFYGGLIGGALGLFIYCKAFKVPFAKYADLYAAGTALGHAFGRLGCLFSGCCFGMPVSESFPFYVIYESSVDPQTPLNTPLLPAQLIEVMYLVVIYVICEIVFYRTKTPANSALTYSLLYATARFILEFFRADDARGIYGGATTSQIISFLIFLLCYTIILLRILRKYGVIKQKVKPQEPEKTEESEPTEPTEQTERQTEPTEPVTTESEQNEA